LLSKYFSKANENKNKEKIDISKEGIKVNSEKKIIYFLLAIDPRILMLFLIEFLISLKIIKKNSNKRIILAINRLIRFFSFKDIKPLSINVKKVTNETLKVVINTNTINMFLFRKVNIN
tara:strand:- start:162 stop:518 length:357 start_codon:yes stop_codon:yes gene_type:complete